MLTQALFKVFFLYVVCTVYPVNVFLVVTIEKMRKKVLYFVHLFGQTPAAVVLRSFQRIQAHLPVGIIPVTTTMARAAPGTSVCTLTRYRSASLLLQTSFSSFSKVATD